jgi:hypothetical protein
MRRRILAVASSLAIVVMAAAGAEAVTTPPVTVSGPTPLCTQLQRRPAARHAVPQFRGRAVGER